MSAEDMVSVIIDKLDYGNPLDRLCCRILKSCILHPTDKIDTAMVVVERSHVAIYYNNTIEDENWLMFLLKHEALHIAYGHIYIDQNDYIKDALNISMDASINPYLLYDTNMFTPVNGPLKERLTFVSGLNSIYDKLTWEHIYNNLLTPNENPPEKQESQTTQEKESSEEKKNEESSESKEKKNEEQQSSEENKSNDNSTDQNETEENTNQNNQNGNGGDDGGNGDDEPNNFGQGDETNGDREIDRDSDTRGNESRTSATETNKSGKYQYGSHITPDIHNMTEPPSRAVQSVLEDVVITAFNDLNIDPGSSMGYSILRGLNYVYTAKQKWRRALSKEVIRATKIRGHESCWKKPNKRFVSSAVPLPGKRKLYYPRIGVLVDSSGSMLEFIPDVLCHIASIASETGTIDRLISGDVRKFLDLKNVTKKQINDIQWSGFGGTYLVDMLKELNNTDCDIIIIITDLALNSTDTDYINTQMDKRHSVILCVPERYQFLIKNITNRRIRTVIIDNEKLVYTKAG